MVTKLVSIASNLRDNDQMAVSEKNALYEEKAEPLKSEPLFYCHFAFGNQQGNKFEDGLSRERIFPQGMIAPGSVILNTQHQASFISGYVLEGLWNFPVPFKHFDKSDSQWSF